MSSLADTISSADAADSRRLDAPSPGLSLLDVLLAVARHHGRPQSLDTLLAGLPACEGAATVAFFRRACDRLGLDTRLVQRPITSLAPNDLPAVALLADDRAFLLTALDCDDRATLLAPAGESQSTLTDLAEYHTGFIILLSCSTRPADAAVTARSWFWGTLRPFAPLYRDIALLAVAINLLGLAMPLLNRVIYDRVIPNQALATLWVLGIGMLLALGFEFMLRTLRTIIIDAAGVRADERLSSAIFSQAMALPLHSSGKTVGGLAEEIREFSSIRDFFTSTTLVTLIDIAFSGIFLVGVAFVAGHLVWIPLLAVPVTIGVGCLFQLPLARSVADTQRESGRQHTMLVETLGSLETLKCLSAEATRQRSWERCAAAAAESAQISRRWSSLAVGIAGSIQQLVTIATLVVGVLMISANTLTSGGLIAATILSGRAVGPIAGLASTLARFHRARLAFRSLDRLMRTPPESLVGPASISLLRARGELEFREVGFRYAESGPATLEKTSFSIKAGERVAIIGRSGSGKTTLCRLLVGLHRPTSGSVHLDGIDVRHLTTADLRRAIGMVTQDPVLFMGTLRENLLLGQPHADDEALLRAARLAGVDEFARLRPEGYGLEVGERGRNLSGGQKQAVAIARVLLRESPVLMLDEPTSSLDAASEAQLIHRLGALLTPGHTLLLTTHRHALLQLVNRVIVLDQGRIVADGPRDEVLRRLQNESSAAAGASTAHTHPNSVPA